MRLFTRAKNRTGTDRFRNEDTREEWKIYNINEVVEEYREKWRHHISRMEKQTLPRAILHYHPTGRRDVEKLRIDGRTT